jgi:hypothetical protein
MRKLYCGNCLKEIGWGILCMGKHFCSQFCLKRYKEMPIKEITREIFAFGTETDIKNLPKK